MTEEAVKVAVRMRGFSQPEMAAGAKRIVRMEVYGQGSRTFVEEPSSGNEKKYDLDYSFQSFSPTDATAGRYYSQEDVFNEVGRPLMEKALEGYHITLFAYGQTGAGKTYSMLGKPDQPGIIPRICEAIFNDIQVQQQKGPPRPEAKLEHKVDIQVVEIYCEMVRDLLADRKAGPPGGLEIKLLPDGPGVKSLKRPCSNYEHIAEAIKKADQNRAVGGHALNAESSRAHTIYTVTYERTISEGDSKEVIRSRLNLVDLAGSERTEKTKTVGQMQKEGIAINQALSYLGDCIQQLSEGRKTISFRNSKLTRLLQGSLTDGKVLMIAAVSPASTCYDETVSTLEFAKRIKTVKIKVTRNVTADPIAALRAEIEARRQELQNEIDELQLQLASGGDPVAMAQLQQALDQQRQETMELQEALEERERELTESSADRARRTQEFSAMFRRVAGGASMKDPDAITLPHLRNLNPDPRLCETLNYEIEQGTSTVGRFNPDDPPKFELNGMGMRQNHAKIIYEGDQVFVSSNTPHARVLVNGRPVSGEGYAELKHNYRVWFGGNYAFRFVFPGHEGEGDPEDPTFASAEEEISQNIRAAGPLADPNLPPLPTELQTKLISAMRLTEQVNIMAKDLTTNLVFVSKIFRNNVTGEPDVCVLVKDGSNVETYWFLDKLDRLREVYEREWQRWERCVLTNEKYIPPAVHLFEDDGDEFIGDADVWLLSLANMMEFECSTPVVSISGRVLAHVRVKLLPLGQDGLPGPWEVGDPNDPYVDNPEELVGREIQFEVHISDVVFEPDYQMQLTQEAKDSSPFHHTHLRYKINAKDDNEPWSNTPVCRSSTMQPFFGYVETHTIAVTPEFLQHLQEGRMLLQLWGLPASFATEDVEEEEIWEDIPGIDDELARGRTELQALRNEILHSEKLLAHLR